MKKTVGILFLLMGLGAFALLGRELLELYSSKQSMALSLSKIWTNDLLLLEQEGKLPENWASIGKVVINPATELAEQLLVDLRSPIKEVLAGDHLLEVLLIAIQEPDQVDVVLQYNLLDANENLTWELGRTFKLPFPLQEQNETAQQQ